MNPADYLELRQLAMDGAAAHSMNAVSILTAYLVAMYFGGKGLSIFQITSVTIIYSVFYLFPVLSVNNGYLHIIALNLDFLGEYPDVAANYRASFLAEWMEVSRIILLSIFFFAWLLSLLFMLSVRKN